VARAASPFPRPGIRTDHPRSSAATCCDVGRPSAGSIIRKMRAAFDDALVSGWDELEGGLLPDQDDRHVLAAAIRGGAQAIITANARRLHR
jgi:hypothetical protein